MKRERDKQREWRRDREKNRGGLRVEESRERSQQGEQKKRWLRKKRRKKRKKARSATENHRGKFTQKWKFYHKNNPWLMHKSSKAIRESDSNLSCYPLIISPSSGLITAVSRSLRWTQELQDLWMNPSEQFWEQDHTIHWKDLTKKNDSLLPSSSYCIRYTDFF